MTVMFHDVHQAVDNRIAGHAAQGANFDEILYADDTIVVSKDTGALNRFLAAIEHEGARYGMKLNKGKFEVVAAHGRPNIHFADGTSVKRMDE
eukprot:4326651-Pyramimonas_sp.AAC.1